ncbi:hypothetical protein TcWFU_000126 [Taenia crassiceps]|uniref:UBZ4-type domain-containing protein n=1 Tax=Taenia crassiceps TaxID=6207 RepID=A0ABR4QFJ4_9CEST
MDESEFVVVDDDHKESAGLDNLAEVVQAYRAARDSLLKGVTLLHDTLNLNMELALKNIPPDFESNSDDLMKRTLGSLNTSSEAVLRSHVKSLCSKLVAVKKEYEDLANKFESLNVQGLSQSSSKFARLVGVFDQIDALLPPFGDTPAAGPSNTAPPSNVEELCTRAESIRDRVKLVMEERLGPASDLEANPSKQSHVSSPKTEPNMDISRMIREEVTSVFQSEMGIILERQRDLIQQVLKPLAESKQMVERTQRPLDEFHESVDGDKSHSVSSLPNAIVEQLRERPTQPPFQTASAASSSVTQPMPPSPNQAGPSRRQKPSFVPNDEEPICPKCQIRLPTRDALEIHIDACLQ